ncbi:class I SAM-dependent methyltransferase [Blastomonas aquatica]|uniref:Methyltransferase n=1 Tax=Blastomonas aquatica TaxID=1510276 RepID=A0ABQ1IY86_9SPHN|nr:class I SAM-dependent methyltransferase [Blastomonas aquatica]GGB55543.1 putative methyltransferase [Blastomonas aquatica]
MFVAYEMMYGSREAFEYFECSQCGSVQILVALASEELAKHYPADYYSFLAPSGSSLKTYLQTERDKALLHRPTLLGPLVAGAKPDPLLAMIGELPLTINSAILDVGCGSGALLDRLGAAGFRNLHGADAFIDDDITTPHGAQIARASLHEVSGTFELIMFHHSLEHVPAPRETLAAARSKLSPGGYCIVRVPTVSSWAWQEYGIDWFQLDAPRHITLPSRAGMRIAGEAASFELVRTIDDSIPQQFEISENYRAGIAMRGDARAPAPSPEQVQTFARKTAEANASGMGDQAAFIFQAI